jgi:hypothetical protein
LGHTEFNLQGGTQHGNEEKSREEKEEKVSH